jgi:hypothetical protein
VRVRPWLPGWPYFVFAIVFATSRMIYRGELGVRFDPSPLFYFIQWVDPWFFENDFVRSILYLHHQAPLPNFVVGAAWLALGPVDSITFLDGMFLAFGATLGFAMIAALERLGVNRLFALVVACAFVATPEFVIYECWLFYHVPIAALMCCSLVALLYFYRRGTFRAALLFFSLLALIALVRNIYGVLWMVVAAAVLLIAPPIASQPGVRIRRTILKALIVPVLLVYANNLKTSLLIGRGFGDALIWTNMVTKIWGELPVAERERLVEEGLVSDAVNHEPYSDPDSVPLLAVEVAETGVPLLDVKKTATGRSNTHSLEHLMVADRYYKPDGKYLLKNYPIAYANAVRWAITDWYMSSPTRDIVLPRFANYKRLGRLDTKLNKLAGLRPTGQILAVMILVPLALAYGVYRLVRTRARLASERSSVVAIAFLLLTILYAGLGTTLVSYGDFSRYRFDVDPFYVILLVLLATQVARFFVRLTKRAFARLRRVAPAR